MADVVAAITALPYVQGDATIEDLESGFAAITSTQTWELDVDGLSDRVIILVRKTDSVAIEVRVDTPSGGAVGTGAEGFSGENLAQVTLTTPAAAGTFAFGPFETYRYKHNVDATPSSDAGKITGDIDNGSAGLTGGEIVAISLPKGVG